MKKNQEIWTQVLKHIEENTTAISYKTWFLTTKVKKIDDDVKVFYLANDDDFVVKILKNRYLNLIEESIRSATGETYRVVVKTSSDYNDIEPEPTPVARPVLMDKTLKKQKIFNPRYTFDNFVVGNSNRYAHAACLAVAETPSEAFNPLFIYGGSGLGKTHLMNAIGIHLLENNEDMNVLYVSAEMFTNEFIKALGENKTREFKNKYRKVDVLLIDDIQFLEGKDTMQEEFFHTFNSLYDLNKQIVISSDRAPNKLDKLEERLRTRFMWNMVADVQPADYETRVAILLKKAENANIEVDDDIYDVICFIADKVKDNIREMEGAFNRIVGFSSIMGEKIDKAFSKRILNDFIENKGTSPTPEKIKSVVCRAYNIKVSEIESSKRTNNIAYPRQVAMYLCREMTDYSLPKIGNLFGGKHYTTVLHACDKIGEELKKDKDLQEMIKRLKKDISE